jgi:hypothetical protein
MIALRRKAGAQSLPKAGRIEVWVTVPVDRTVHAYQGNSAHVADDSVIFDRLIRHSNVPPLVEMTLPETFNDALPAISLEGARTDQ